MTPYENMMSMLEDISDQEEYQRYHDILVRAKDLIKDSDICVELAGAFDEMSEGLESGKRKAASLMEGVKGMLPSCEVCEDDEDEDEDGNADEDYEDEDDEDEDDDDEDDEDEDDEDEDEDEDDEDEVVVDARPKCEVCEDVEEEEEVDARPKAVIDLDDDEPEPLTYKHKVKDTKPQVTSQGWVWVGWNVK